MAELPQNPAFRARLKAHRDGWVTAPRPTHIEQPGPGQESVWDYPRPPDVRAVSTILKVVFAGEVVAETNRGLKVCETAGAPVYHFPPDDVRREFLRPVPGTTFCEWKGEAAYFDLVVGDRSSAQAAYTYPDPIDDLGHGYDRIAGAIVFYAGRVDEAWVGDERATP
ncbi:MAG: DUF427 domain-containing protein, partial [Pseudomonadota bacterium]